MGHHHVPTKKRLYLSHPEPDIVTTRRRITRYIPPSPPPVEEPPPCPTIVEPEPEPIPCLPEPEPEPEPEIEVISVDVEPHHHHRRHKSKSRSRSRSERDKEVYVERDHYVPVPVYMEPQYETYRYVEGPRRPAAPPEPQRKAITDGEVHVHIEDRRRSHDYYRR